jgi:hypothetical protein
MITSLIFMIGVTSAAFGVDEQLWRSEDVAPQGFVKQVIRSRRVAGTNSRGATMDCDMVRVTAQRPEGTPARLTVNASMFDEIRQTDQVDVQISPIGFAGYAKSAPSGIPLGMDLRWSQKESGLDVHVSASGEYLNLSVFLNVTKGSNYTPPSHDWTEDRQMLERLARRLMARAAGVRLGGFNTRTLAGTSIQSATCTKTNRRFGNLRSYAMNKGWKVAANDDLAYWTLSKGDHYAVIPYGSGRIKFDGTWVKMADVTMEKEGVLLAGEDVLNRLNAMD